MDRYYYCGSLVTRGRESKESYITILGRSKQRGVMDLSRDRTVRTPPSQEKSRVALPKLCRSHLGFTKVSIEQSKQHITATLSEVASRDRFKKLAWCNPQQSCALDSFFTLFGACAKWR